MKVGDKFRVRQPGLGTLPSVAALAGMEGVITEKVKYIGAPIIARLSDGGTWHCWPNEIEILSK